MSDIRMNSGSLSSSPGARSSLDRPLFPWASPSAPLRVAHRNSQSTIHSPSPLPASSPWDPRVSGSLPGSSAWPGSMSRQNTGSAGGQSFQDESTRQWTFMGFEWTVRDVRRLREFVEGNSSLEASDDSALQQEDFEVLRNSPIISGRFKLEVAPALVNQAVDAGEVLKPQRLSLYLTSLYLSSLMMEMEVAHEMPTSIMVAIRSSAERGARPDWVWEQWTDWVFRQESESWECSLPTISSLLENSRILESDSFIISLQIQAPVGQMYPQQPDAHYVPKDLLDGIEASLDNSNTGDVQFICLEKFPEAQASPTSDVNPHSRRSSSSSSASPFSSRATARKRVIYAHSDILIRRSEYFGTMLNSSFAETTTNTPGERKVWRVVVEETDFQTMYWVLKYLYASYCIFKEHDDPRAAVEGVGTGWSARWLHTRGGEWDWKSFPKTLPGDDHGDSRSIASVESGASGGDPSKPIHAKEASFPQGMSNAPGTRTANRSSSLTSTKPPVGSGSRTTPTTVARKSTSGGGPAEPSGTTSNKDKHVLPLTIPTAKYGQSHYPISPRSQRNPSALLPQTDPHPHPTPCPSAASALSVYQVAHRYNMPKLANLALDHILATITPETSLAFLLATAVWDDLRNLIEEYVVQQWDEVSSSSEFERCLEEISAGEWGPEGGKTLTRLFRRLRSPVA